MASSGFKHYVDGEWRDCVGPDRCAIKNEDGSPVPHASTPEEMEAIEAQFAGVDDHGLGGTSQVSTSTDDKPKTRFATLSTPADVHLAEFDRKALGYANRTRQIYGLHEFPSEGEGAMVMYEPPEVEGARFQEFGDLYEPGRTIVVTGRGKHMFHDEETGQVIPRSEINEGYVIDMPKNAYAHMALSQHQNFKDLKEGSDRSERAKLALAINMREKGCSISGMSAFPVNGESVKYPEEYNAPDAADEAYLIEGDTDSGPLNPSGVRVRMLVSKDGDLLHNDNPEPYRQKIDEAFRNREVRQAMREKYEADRENYVRTRGAMYRTVHGAKPPLLDGSTAKLEEKKAAFDRYIKGLQRDAETRKKESRGQITKRAKSYFGEDTKITLGRNKNGFHITYKDSNGVTTGSGYIRLNDEGKVEFEPRKGGPAAATKTLQQFTEGLSRADVKELYDAHDNSAPDVDELRRMYRSEF